ncbi:MAG: cupin-like domain-containing protein [Myxococcaceae bacterium]|nr:cupin-like domain-containing protein [Myxococcaceae bacterium]
MTPPSQAQYPGVDRRRDLSPQEFAERYVSQNRPVVLEGAARGWAERWTPSMLKERFGDRTIAVESNHHSVIDIRKTQLPLRRFLEMAEASSLEYRFRSIDFTDTFPELESELAADAYFASYFPTSKRRRTHAFWVSPSGNYTSLHHDAHLDNLNVQVFGSKTFVLIAPSQHPFISPFALFESPVNPFWPDHARFPKFAQAKVQEAVLKPGDMLFVPRYWWHSVAALSLSININTWSMAEDARSWSTLAGVPFGERLLLTLNEKLGVSDRFPSIETVVIRLAGKRPAPSPLKGPDPATRSR